MKKYLLKTFLTVSILTVFTEQLISQAPQGINYQAVIRNNVGAVVTNTAVSIRMNVIQGSSTGTVSYSEKHNVTTNSNGLVNVVIGQGTALSGTFTSINWANGAYFIETAYDVNNSGTFTVLGTQQLLSVPYALYAASSGTQRLRVIKVLRVQRTGPQGIAGTNGVSITNSYVQNDSLYVVLSNGQQLNAGYVKGSTGATGPQGIQGFIGPIGPQGIGGANGTNNCFACPTMISNVSSNTMMYSEASLFCSNLIEGGYNDWRLPYLSEFEYLRDVVNLTVPSENCFIKDVTIVPYSTYGLMYVQSTNRTVFGQYNLAAINWKTVCIR